MTPHESARDILTRGFALVLEGIEAMSREATYRAPRDPEQILTAADVRAEFGYSTDSVALWCKRGEIAGAYRRKIRGRWHFTRAAFSEFIRGHRRRRRLTIAA